MAENLILSIKKALNIIDILVFEDFEEKGIALFELARRTGQKPNTLHNILKTMIACGYVAQNSEGRYAAGQRCRDIGAINRISPRSNLYKHILREVEALGQKIGESAVFTVLANVNRLPVIRYEHESLIKVDTSFYENENIYLRDTGRVLAAFSDEPGLSVIMERWGMPKENWDGIEDLPSLKKAIKKIQSDGYSLSLTDDGVVSMAVPVFCTPLGALGCYAPAFRCDKEKQQFMLESIQEAAKRIAEF